MKFRKAKVNDIQQIMYIIEEAKVGLKEQQIDQWQNGYPNKESILNDITNSVSYILEDNYQIVATCMISSQNDPNYTRIEDGSWLQDDCYLVIHRIATHPQFKGKNIASLIINKAPSLYPTCKSIRVDTHENNISMQRLLEKNGFVYCGIIYVTDGKRKAFEKIIES